jgi:hypothetical protein
MARVHCLAALLWASLTCGAALATFPAVVPEPQNTWDYTLTVQPPTAENLPYPLPQYKATPQAACNDAASQYTSVCLNAWPNGCPQTYTPEVVGANTATGVGGSCIVRNTNGTIQYNNAIAGHAIVQQGSAYCPESNSSLIVQSSPPTCQCDTGYNQAGSERGGADPWRCVSVADTNNCQAAAPAGTWRWEGRVSDVFLCDIFQPSGGSPPYCEVVAHREIGYMVGEDWQSMGPGLYTGAKCANTPGAGDGTSGSPYGSDPTLGGAPGPGEVGKDNPGTPCDGYMGEVNGVPTCIPKTGVTGINPYPKTTTTSTSSPEGTTTQTVTKDTTCGQAECTTTETRSTTSNGSTTVVVTTTSKPITDYCTENKTARECGGTGGTGLGGEGGDTAFGGTCAGEFNCTGDAVECAIATAVNRARCLLTPSAEIEQVAGQLAAGTFGQALPVTEKDLSAFDQTNPLGSGCPGDQVLVLGGTSVTLPFSAHCSELQLLGNLIVTFTLLWATIFVLKGLGGT